jgi:hypothetical protein
MMHGADDRLGLEIAIVAEQIARESDPGRMAELADQLKLLLQRWDDRWPVVPLPPPSEC